MFLPKNQRRRIIAEKAFDLVSPFRHARIYPEELAADPVHWVMIFRESMVPDIEALDLPSSPTVIYSLWPGYLERPQSLLRDWCQSGGIDFIVAHTSGHADPTTLKRFAEALRPATIIPIHTEVPETYSALFGRAVVLEDGAWFDIPQL